MIMMVITNTKEEKKQPARMTAELDIAAVGYHQPILRSVEKPLCCPMTTRVNPEFIYLFDNIVIN